MTFELSRFTAKLHAVDLSPELASLSLPPVDLRVYDTVTSTNRVLWELIAQGSGEGTAVLALRQESGRGQWGRTWESGAGGLYLSAALEPRCAVADAGQLMLCTTWGVASALRHHHVPVQIKWFNDLVVGRQKLGGILIETRIAGESINQAVVGVGINWNNPVPETGTTLQSVIKGQDAPMIQTLEEVAAIALNGIRAGYGYWQAHGIDSIMPSYQRLLSRIGTLIKTNQTSGEIVGVSTSGNLRVMALNAQGQPITEVQFQPGELHLGYH